MAHAHLPKTSLRSPAVAEEKYPSAALVRLCLDRVVRGRPTEKPADQFSIHPRQLRSTYRRLLYRFTNLLALALLPSSLPVLAANFQVHGELFVKDYIENGEIKAERRMKFSASIEDCEWLIRTTPISGDITSEIAEFYEIGTDGTNTFKRTRFNQSYDPTAKLTAQLQAVELQLQGITPGESPARTALTRRKLTYTKALEQLQQKGKRKHLIGDQAEINLGDAPLFNTDFIQPIWLAFASSCYLRRATNGMLPRVWTYEHPIQVFTNNLVEATWNTTPESPYLATNIIFLNNGTYYVDSYHGVEKNVNPMRLPKPYENGYTNAIYRADSLTNFEGLMIPLHFKLTRLERVQDPKHAADLRIFSSAEASVSHITHHDAGRFLPDISTNTTVVDRRFFLSPAHPNEIDYISPSNSWLAMEQAHKTKAAVFQAANKQKESKAGQSVSKRRIVVVVLLGFCGLVGISILWRSVRS